MSAFSGVINQSIRARGKRARSFTSNGMVWTTSPSAEGLIKKMRENSADCSPASSAFFIRPFSIWRFNCQS
jgi:hypothetical protein